jgi:LPXTG-motif cell wall-anchored protein
MKKNNLFILLGLAAIGGAWYYMKKKKKGVVTVPEPEKITEQEFNQSVEQPEPMQALINVVKKVTQPSAAKKAQKEKLKAATAFANYFGTPTQKKIKVKKVKAKKVGELSVLI